MRFVFITVVVCYINLLAQLNSNCIFYNNELINVNLYGNVKISNLVTNLALDFDGIDDYAQTNNLLIDYSKGFTISFWIKPRGFIEGANEETYILSNANSSDTFYWAIKFTKQTASSSQISFVIAYLDKYYEVKTSERLLLNQTYHLSCIYSKDKISIFLNGKKQSIIKIDEFDFSEQNLIITVGANHYTLLEKKLPVWIKDIPVSERQNVIYGYSNCIVDVIKIFNKIMSDNEIVDNYKRIEKTNLQKVKIILYEPLLTRGLKVVKDKLVIKGEVNPVGVASNITVNNNLVEFFDGKYFNTNYIVKNKNEKITIKAIAKNNEILDEVSFNVVNKDEERTLNFGKYYALVIACQNYKEKKIEKLENPIIDGTNIIEEITKNYKFDKKDIIFLKDATYDDIISSLDRINKLAKNSDNILIFFAGHGIYDNELEQGFWLPIDAKLGNRSKWISNTVVKDYLKGNKAQSILVISDACFSGALIKTRAVNNFNKYIDELIKNKSRKALTSGVLTTVPDKSVFVKYLLQELKNNDKLYLPAEELYFRIKEKVVLNSPTKQIPMYGEIYNTGDEGGDFIFVKKFAK
ncbi:MAG TPA: caspase family protein [Ignavibacteriales bacterium]|mgnify:CR=1 FL=1|nr:caspase family protein [Ignavibacteriales bacterium]HOL81578.1 caspase family protein [Ignavibacteriales bacterium]HOM65592.1 caspase family protein [Ignavibacteriales bacterium]HPD67800.1 caspase family protein [Ignavibacteriales bacterium]HPP33692.1 caspase family protein [Ignavibacteriales bacterium]